MNKPVGHSDTAQALALKVIAFLARDAERMERFCRLSGATEQTLKFGLSDPNMLAGVLDYLLQDETLLFMFAEDAQIDPAEPMRAHQVLTCGGSAA